MGSAAASIDSDLFCERCGEVYAPKKPVCAGCGSAPARHWLQLTALSTLGLATFCNSLVCWLLLPRLVSRNDAQIFRGWLSIAVEASLHGWGPLILRILAWSYFYWCRP